MMLPFALILVTLRLVAFAETLPEDVDALLQFRDELDVAAVLNDDHPWENGTDPCDDHWIGVICDCETATLETQRKLHPCPQQEGGYERVYALDLSEVRQPEKNQGRISSHIGNLVALRHLNLQSNDFWGTIPHSLNKLVDLETLILNDNKLTGSLPGFLPDLQHLKYAMFSNNYLEGRIPLSWCDLSNVSVVDVTNNPRLCDITNETTCLWNSGIDSPYSIETASGAALIFNTYADSTCCDARPPVCDSALGCGVTVPDFWTDAAQVISFNYTNFTSTTGSALSYHAVSYFVSNSSKNLTKDVCLFLDGYVPPSIVWIDTHIETESKAVGNVNTFTANVTHSDQNSGLVSGQLYKVMVIARDDHCPSICAFATSDVVKTDYENPMPTNIFNTDDYKNLPDGRTEPAGSFGISFTPFQTNMGVGCCNYSVTVQDSMGQLLLDPPIHIGNATAHSIPVELEAGNAYYGVVYAESASARIGTGKTDIVMVSGGETSNDTTLVLFLVLCIGPVVPVTLAILAVLYMSRRRTRRAAWEMERRRMALEDFKSLLMAMDKSSTYMYDSFSSSRQYRSTSSDLPHLTQQPSMWASADVPHLNQQASLASMWSCGDANNRRREFTFVVTDLENSTACAAADKAAYTLLQMIHDQLMREEIPKHHGCEIGTQGDSFEIVFGNVCEAVQFCMTVQLRLLNTQWPDNVLKLPSNNMERDADGEVCFRGPRVRMGLHWAREGSDVRCSEHNQTRLNMFQGPAWDVVNEVADGGAGGQIIITHAAWVQLQQRMGAAGFPVVQRLGLFSLEAGGGATMWLYEVQRPLYIPLFRTFPAPRKMKCMMPASSYEVVQPPKTNSTEKQEELVFVCCRLDLYTHLLGCGDNTRSLGLASSSGTAEADQKWLGRLTRRLSKISTLFNPLPKGVGVRISNYILAVAMQYRGYAFGRTNLERHEMLFVFRDVSDALCFCHAVQISLLVMPWGMPDKTLARLFGPTEAAFDGRHLFHGPRVAMAMCASHKYSRRQMSGRRALVVDGREEWPSSVVFEGEGVEVVRAICGCCGGGQVVVPLMTWQRIAAQLPVQIQVLSLGEYILPGDDEASALMEVLPAQLMQRTFQPIAALEKVGKGYRDSPDPDHDMALCYVKVAKPFEVHEATVSCKRRAGDTWAVDGKGVASAAIDTLTCWYMGIYMVENTVRALLKQYDGYECKHPQPGKMTLAFSDMKQCLEFCCALQSVLLDLSWPDQLLQWRECREQEDANGVVIFRGLQVSMGVTWGMPALRKPLNTGRADYFGNLANLAARVCASAHPGEVLVVSSPHLLQMSRTVNGQRTPLSTCLSKGVSTTSSTSSSRAPSEDQLRGYNRTIAVYTARANLAGNLFHPVERDVVSGDDAPTSPTAAPLQTIEEGGKDILATSSALESAVSLQGHKPRRSSTMYRVCPSALLLPSASADNLGQAKEQLFIGDSPADPAAILLRPLGFFTFKGISGEPEVFEVVLHHLSSRTFLPHPQAKPYPRSVSGAASTTSRTASSTSATAHSNSNKSQATFFSSPWKSSLPVLQVGPGTTANDIMPPHQREVELAEIEIDDEVDNGAELSPHQVEGMEKSTLDEQEVDMLQRVSLQQPSMGLRKAFSEGPNDRSAATSSITNHVGEDVEHTRGARGLSADRSCSTGVCDHLEANDRAADKAADQEAVTVQGGRNGEGDGVAAVGEERGTGSFCTTDSSGNRPLWILQRAELLHSMPAQWGKLSQSQMENARQVALLFAQGSH